MQLPAGSMEWLGATPESGGTHFVVYAGKEATQVQLCLFDRAINPTCETRYELMRGEEVRGPNRDKETGIVDERFLLGHYWSGFAQGVGAGALYGFRIDGPYVPQAENPTYYNPHKILVPPETKAVTHAIHEWPSSFYHNNNEDNAAAIPKGRVVDWKVLAEKAARPGALYNIPDSVYYEMHVKGGTMIHPDIPEAIRGTYKALSHPAFIGELKRRGVTTLELLPVSSFGSDPRLVQLGKRNWWGYMTDKLQSFHTDYAASDHPEEEFVESVRILKSQGIEVVMDFVPNHLLEGGPDGPVVNARGMDNRLYLPYDITGTGNTLDYGHPVNRRMVLESARYFRMLGVSGLRIDLAAVIARENGQFNAQGAMMQLLHSDPELSDDFKISGEPWDLHGMYLGEMAKAGGIIEWNSRYRDSMMNAAFNHENQVSIREIALCLGITTEGIDAPYDNPTQYIAKLLSHDGPAAADLVSNEYGKNNWINGENNRDGNDMSRDFYWGKPEDRLHVLRFGFGLHALTPAALLLKQGDDQFHSQDWCTNKYSINKNPNAAEHNSVAIKHAGEIPVEGQALADFIAQGLQLRRRHAMLRRARFFHQAVDQESDFCHEDGHPLRDAALLHISGRPLCEEEKDQHAPFAILYSGDPGNSPAEEKSFVRRVQHGHEAPLLILINPTRERAAFTLPALQHMYWNAVLNSHQPDAIDRPPENNQVMIDFFSMMVFEPVRELSKQPTALSRELMRRLSEGQQAIAAL